MQLSFLLFIFFQLGSKLNFACFSPLSRFTILCAHTGLVMGISVQDTAPSFSAEALMPDASFGTVSSEDYKGTWWILFTYPLDWTFVCPTEIAAFSDRSSEFEAIGCKVVGCSVDSKFSHLAWVKQPRTEGGLGPMNIPLIGDLDKSIATKYGVLLDAGIALRGLFVIDPDQKIRAQMVYDLPVGRDVDEVLRVVRALQFTDKHGEVCPAGWQPGE
ncbi:unnamed protein product [Chrysoparadoxa australica]